MAISSPIDTEFPAEFANTIARLESYNKHLYRPNSYLHKWWARRCGSTFRLILKSLVEDPVQRDYYAAGGLEGRVILDPMMGGGSTLHEAIRLGANVIGVDLDPIPVLQARATLSKLPLDKLERAFQTLYRALRDELAHLFETACPACGQPTDLRFTLHGVRRSCRCGPAILVDSYVLRQQSDGSTFRICPRCHQVTKDDRSCSCSASSAALPLIDRSGRVCHDCGGRYQEETGFPFYARYEPLVVVGECGDHGPFFIAPTAADLERQREADSLRPSFPLNEFAIRDGPKSADLLRREVSFYPDLFSSRQLLFLRHAIDLLPDGDPLVRLNLALLISTSLDFNSMLCGYKGAGRRRPGAIRHSFSHHAYSFPYTALENNPLYPGRTSGTLQKLFHDRIRRARRWAEAPVERMVQGGESYTVIEGEVDAGREVDQPTQLREGTRRFCLIQGSSASLDLEDNSVDAVITDPPYYDSVQYSDLAAFFRVWLRQMVPETADWEVDLGESAVDSRDDAGERYTELLSAILGECHRVLKKGQGRLVFTFHHWNPRAWTALTLALRRARFALLNRYVVHAENPSSVHIANLKALTHDAVLVLAPIEAYPRPAWQLPVVVDKEGSYRFCQDCSSVLGWMLETDLTEAEIAERWLRLLDDGGEMEGHGP
jgi:putative DNA methylase